MLRHDWRVGVPIIRTGGTASECCAACPPTTIRLAPFEATQQELPEAANLLDLSNDRFDDRVARRIDGRVGLGNLPDSPATVETGDDIAYEHRGRDTRGDVTITAITRTGSSRNDPAVSNI
jgi:hypothetical protein